MKTNENSLIGVTGRIDSWKQNPDGRLPVSCTVCVVEDGMEDERGIEASWLFTSYGLRYGAGVSIHLSKLRPKGSVNAKGLVASGPMSFARIYSVLNEILRRGGLYKNGATVVHLDYTHPDALHFVNGYDKREYKNITILQEEILLAEAKKKYEWVKRCLNVDENFLENASPELISDTLAAIARGDLWLNKIRYHDGERIYANVCLEVYIRSHCTCLLSHGNLGQAVVGPLLDDGTFYTNIVDGIFIPGMKELCEIHARTGVDKDGVYESPENDKQVGFGLIGLANFLSIHGITYKEFGEELKEYNKGKTLDLTKAAARAVTALAQGISAAAEIARSHNMERAFAIAPTATCSYKYKDARGFTTTPEIAPPISRQVERDSQTMGTAFYDYGDVETATQVGWETYKLVVDELVRLYQATGLFHGYSFNSWSDQVRYDRKFLQDWLESPQTSLYYALQVKEDTLSKDDALVSLENEDLKTFFGFDQLEDLEGCIPCQQAAKQNNTECTACGE